MSSLAVRCEGRCQPGASQAALRGGVSLLGVELRDEGVVHFRSFQSHATWREG